MSMKLREIAQQALELKEASNNIDKPLIVQHGAREALKVMGRLHIATLAQAYLIAEEALSRCYCNDIEMRTCPNCEALSRIAALEGKE